MRCIGRVPRRLQREIGLDRTTEVESAAVEQRPTAIGTLGRTDVLGDACLELGLDLAEIMLEQNELRRDSNVGLQLEDPMPVRVLECYQRFACSHDRFVEPVRGDAA